MSVDNPFERRDEMPELLTAMLARSPILPEGVVLAIVDGIGAPREARVKDVTDDEWQRLLYGTGQVAVEGSGQEL